MHIEYLDQEVRLAVTRPLAPAGWTTAEIARLRLLVQCLLAATTPSDLVHMQSLRLQPHADDHDAATTDLSAGRTLNVAFKADSTPLIAVLDTTTARTDSP